MAQLLVTSTTRHGTTAIPTGLVQVFPSMVSCQGFIASEANDHCGRSSLAQGGYQIAALLVSVAMGLAGGLIVGLLLRISSRFLSFMAPLGPDEFFDDDATWKVDVEDAEASDAEDLRLEASDAGEVEVQVIGKSDLDLPSTLKGRAEPGCMDRCLPFGRSVL